MGKRKNLFLFVYTKLFSKQYLISIAIITIRKGLLLNLNKPLMKYQQ